MYAASANCPSYRRFPLNIYRFLFEKLKVSKPVKNFHVIYAIRIFIAAFTTALTPVTVLCHSNPVNAPFYILRTRFNTTLPFNTWSFK